MRRITMAGLLMVGLTAHAQPAAVTGMLTVDSTKVALQSAAAIGYAGPSGRLVSVLLSDKAAAPAEFTERTRIGAGERYVPAIFEGAWKSLHLEKALSGLTFTIDANRKLLTNELLVGGDNAFMVSPDDLVVELKSVSPRLVGRIQTKPPLLDLGSRKVQLDATFDVQVAERAK